MEHREIFLNRIEIIIFAEISLEVFQKLLDDMLPIYSQHITSFNDIFPGIGPPYELLTLRLDDFPAGQQRSFEDLAVPLTEISIHLEGTEGDMRFVNSEDAITANFVAMMERGMQMIAIPGFLDSFMRMTEGRDETDG